MGERPDRQIAKYNIAALAREHSPKAIAKLAQALDHEDMRIAIDAASKLLDRGYGKPSQTITRDDNPADKMSDAELIAAIRTAALEGVEETREGKGLTH